MCVHCRALQSAVWGGPSRADQWTDSRQTAAECRGALEEGASEGINTRGHTGFCSDPEPFTGGRRAQSLFFKLLGLKSGFIFTLRHSRCLPLLARS